MTKKLPPTAQIFLDHLELGLECFDLDLADYQPFYLKHKEYGVGCSFSQLKNNVGHTSECIAKNSLIVSGSGLHFADSKLLPFSNEQPPTHLALLVLSSMVKDTPLQFICEKCHGS